MPSPNDATYTERDRDQLLSDISRTSNSLDRIGGPIVKCELADLGERIAEVEKIAADFITRLRLLTT